MALITACINSELIRLLGRWQSDVMLRYLHSTVRAGDPKLHPCHELAWAPPSSP
jgi:hypothetical protein